jgi:hypothetical protein
MRSPFVSRLPDARLGGARPALLGIAAMLLGAGALGAQSSAAAPELIAGSRVRVEAPGVVPHHFIGRVLLPPSDTLLLASQNGPPVTIRTSKIVSLDVSRGRSRPNGALRGVLLGTPVGFGLGMLFGSSPRCDVACPFLVRPPRRHYGGSGAVAGALAGLFFGAIIGHERWSRVSLAAAEP